MSNHKFRVAVIGLGWWGQTISRLIKTSDVLELVAGSDLNQTTGRAFTQELGVDFLNSVIGHAGWPEKAIPGGVIKAGEGLSYGRCVGHQVRTFGVANGERPHFAHA